MLTITVPGKRLWDEEKEEFRITKSTVLKLEHSLVSISKWESKWHKPFLSKDMKTDEEIIDYIRAMTLTQNVDPNVYMCLTNENVKKINEYIEDPMTATWFGESEQKKRNGRIITSELIYCWMIMLNIPVEFQKWPINRLMTLIKVCEIENAPKKKQSTGEIMRKQAELNAQRRKMMNSKG